MGKISSSLPAPTMTTSVLSGSAATEAMCSLMLESLPLLRRCAFPVTLKGVKGLFMACLLVRSDVDAAYWLKDLFCIHEDDSMLAFYRCTRTQDFIAEVS